MGLTLSDLEKLESLPFRLPCRRCSAYGIRLKPTPDVCKGFWDYFCGVKWGVFDVDSYGSASPEFRRFSVLSPFSSPFSFLCRFFQGAEGRGRNLWHPSPRPLFVGRVRVKTPMFSGVFGFTDDLHIYIFIIIIIIFFSVTLPTPKKNFRPRKSRTCGSTRDIFPLFPPLVPT